MLGDIGQLPPVSDKTLYYPSPDTDVALLGYFAYYQIRNVIKLEVNQRVNRPDQQIFREILTSLRNGCNNVDDWEHLCSRNVTNFHSPDFNNMPICLTFSNEAVANYNYDLLKSSRPIYPVKAKHNVTKASKLSSEKFCGLEPFLHLAVDAQVMLTRNLWVEKGLCNGSMGTVKQIIYKCNQRPSVLPVAVMIKFDKYSGPTFQESGLIPIVPVSSTTENKLERVQLPIKLSWSITIHKSQG